MAPNKDLASHYQRLLAQREVASNAKDRETERTALLALAELAWQYQDLVTAERRLQEALVCAISHKNVDAQCALLARLGALEAERGNPQVAVAHYKAVLEHSGPDETSLIRGEALLAVGQLLLGNQQAVVARAWLEEALINFQKNRAVTGEAKARLALADLYFQTANLDAAESECRKALLVASEGAEGELATRARLTLGTWIALRSSGLGVELIQDALRLAQEKGLLKLEREAWRALAEVYRHDGLWELSAQAWESLAQSEARLRQQERSEYQAYLCACLAPKVPVSRRTVSRGATVAQYEANTSHELLHALLLDAALVGGSFAVALVDIDHFRKIRQQCGDGIATRVRQRAMELMVQSLRTGDTLAHHAGQEFVIALPGASPRQARTIAERLRKSVGEADWQALYPNLMVTLSIGVCIGSSGTDPEAVFRAADKNLDEARSAGYNRVEVSQAG